MFGSIGMPELIIIFVIALIIFGPRKLPELGRSLGKSLAEFKKASNELKSTLEEEIRLEEQRSTHRSRQGGRQPSPRRPAIPRRSPTSTCRRRQGRPERVSARHGPRAVPGPPVGGSPASSGRRRRRSRPPGRCRFWSISTSSGSASSTRRSRSRVGVVVGFAFINRIVDFILAPTRGALPPGVKMIYTRAGRGVLALHPDRADHGRRARGAVHHVSGVDVHRAGALLEREAAGDSVRAVHDDRLRRSARRSTTTSRSRS